MSERTGRQWLKECSESPMVKKVAHGVYEKNFRLINEDNIDEEWGIGETRFIISLLVEKIGL